MKVKIFGPNLSGAAQRKGDFHVHAADCADCKFYGPGRKYGGDSKPTAMEAETEKAVVLSIYPPDDFEYDEKDWTGFAAGVWFAPCAVLA